MIAPYPLDRDLTEDDERLVAYYQLAKVRFCEALSDGLEIEGAIKQAADLHHIPVGQLRDYLEHDMFSLEIQRDLNREAERQHGFLRKRAKAYVDQHVVDGVDTDPLFLCAPKFNLHFEPQERAMAGRYAASYAWYLTQFHEMVGNAPNP